VQVGSVINCADNTGAKSLFIISAKGVQGRLNRYPKASVGDMVIVSVKKGPPDLRKKVALAVVVRQRMPYKRPDGTVISFEDNAGVIVKPNGELKGNTVLGPTAKEATGMWPKVAAAAGNSV
jgi:large subunit ribosomal protein L23e